MKSYCDSDNRTLQAVSGRSTIARPFFPTIFWSREVRLARRTRPQRGQSCRWPGCDHQAHPTYNNVFRYTSTLRRPNDPVYAIISAGLCGNDERSCAGLHRRNEHCTRLPPLRRFVDAARWPRTAIWLANSCHSSAGSDATLWPARLALDRASGRMGAAGERYEPNHSYRCRYRSCAEPRAQPLPRRENADGRSPSGRRTCTFKVHGNCC